jgi:translation initiation factor 1
MAKKKLPLVQPDSPTWPSFGDALRARGVSVGTETSSAQAPPPARGTADDGAPDLSRSGKIVVRRERKGHGGKTVTVIDGLKLGGAQLESVARILRKALGCGSRVEDGRLVVQGDLATAVATWLGAHGAARVIVGN